MPEISSDSSTLVEILRWRSENQPDRLAYTFLTDGESEEATITYRELDRQARAIAATLQSRSVVGDRVPLLYPPGLEYIAAFLGCLYAGVAAVPLYPPRRNRSLLRLQSLLDDADASAALTTNTIISRMRPFLAEHSELRKLDWLTADNVTSEIENEWRPPAINADTLAFLQYTSGSTSAPKGVMLSHRNLMHNERLIRSAFQQAGHSVIVGWLPLYHDMGLIGNVLQALYVGAPCILMSPAAFLQRPVRWLQAMSRYRGTTSGGPNFAYELCVRKVTDAQRETLDLTSWSVAFNGAEPVRAETMERFVEKFSACGFRQDAFRPCYGMAEATLLVSATTAGDLPVVKTVSRTVLEQGRIEEVVAPDDEVRRIVSCGKAFSNEEVLIVNPESLKQCDAAEVGEVWLASPSVAAGYWNDSVKTADAFGATVSGLGRGPFLRTGDLGFIHDSEIFLTGRLKDLIIVRGLNHYPQDIELSVEQSHPALRPGCGAAFAVTFAGDERLVVAHEIERRYSSDFEDIFAVIRETLAQDNELQAHTVLLLKAGSIPKTSSGKIQRQACRTMFLEGRLDVVAQWQSSAVTGSEVASNAAAVASAGKVASMTRAELVEPGVLENWLRAQLAAQLGVPETLINVDQSIMRYGVDSLLSTELTHRIETELGLLLPMSSLLQNPSIVHLAAQLRELLAEPARNARLIETSLHEAGDGYSLSHGQKALWYLQQVARQSAAYNIAHAARVLGPLDRPALGRALQSLVDRHAALRTSFDAPGGAPRQRVHRRLEISILDEDASTWDENLLRERLAAEANRAFDLESVPLLRVSLFARSANEHVLLLVVHHIVSDLWSLAIMIDELGLFYQAERTGEKPDLPQISVTYTDFVRQQNQAMEGDQGERHWQFWREYLHGELPVLNLPTDKPRPPIQSYLGSSHAFPLSPRLTRALKELSQDCEATLYMTLLAAFQVLLARYSRQDEIIVGSPTTGRTSAEFVNVLGYFVNPIVLRADLSADPTFSDFLRQVRRSVLAALEHQEYPFALLVKRLQPPRDPSRTPLFQAEFAWQKTHGRIGRSLTEFVLGGDGAQMPFGDLTLEPFSLAQQVEQFDVTLMMAEAGEGLLATFEYSADLFERATIERLAGHFQQLLEGIVADPLRRVSELPLLTDVERDRHLLEWNATEAAYPREKCAHELFAEQAARTPDAVAVVSDHGQLTYAQLNNRANQLAHYLQRLGVGPDAPVSICVERSLEMIIGLLGILKSGGAFVPLDPQTPQKRLAFTLKDTESTLLLTQSHLAENLVLDGIDVLRLDTDWSSISEESTENPVRSSSPDNLAYVIYTSGSTGKPKGVMISHEGLVNYLNWCARFCAEGEGAPVHTSFAFDLGLTALFPPLVAGRSITLASEDDRVAAIADIMRRGRDFSLIKVTPSHLEVLKQSLGAGEIAGRTRVLVIGGEALQFEALSWWRANAPATRLINHYGPTETVIGCCVYEVPDELPPTGRVPIGLPINNKALYVLDGRQQPVPIGVAGEIYVGGVGVARGYFKRPDLTADKFIPDSFSRVPGSRMYRTGDLARRRPDGNIEFLGRIDQQVKIRGYRVEPGEIEVAIGEHESVRDVAVVAEAITGRSARLIAYLVPNGGPTLNASEWRNYLKERLPDYMVPSAFVTLDELPLTPNGKLDQRRLPSADEAQSESNKEIVAPRNEIERQLAAIWQKILRVERVGIHDNFFELGGDSILSIQIVARVNEAGLGLTPKQLFQHHTIAELAAVVTQAGVAEAEETTATAAPPLTPIQQWFFEQSFSDPHHWNQAVMLELKEAFDLELLKQAVGHLLIQHPALRLRFSAEAGNWQQFVAESTDVAPFSYLDLSNVPAAHRTQKVEEAAQTLQSRLNICDGPIIRVAYLDLGAGQRARLLFVVHHLAMDAVSWRILLEDLVSIYEQLKQGLEVKIFKTASFPRWAKRLQTYGQTARLQDEAEYWVRQANGVMPRLPVDGEAADNSYASAGTVTVQLSVAETGALLREVPHTYRTQINEVLLAALGQALSRWTGERKVLIDVEGHGREPLFDDVDVSRTVGWFTTHYPVVLEIDNDVADPGELLLSVKEQTRRIPNRGIGYGLLRYAYGDLAVAEKLHTAPPAEILFNYLGQLDHALPENAPFKIATEPLGATRSPRARRSHLLEVIGSISGERLCMEWNFGEKVHHRSTIELVAQHFIEYLGRLVTHCNSVDVLFHTPSDFPLAQIGQEQLDKAFAEVSFEN